MTRAEALAEAQKRWGPTAFAAIRRDDTRLVGKAHYNEGYLERPALTNTIGKGASWEAAFADADQRAK